VICVTRLRSCWGAVTRTYARRLVPGLGCVNRRMTDLQAALCALRVIRRVPDLMDHFTSKAKSLLQDRNHGVLLAGITLVTEMCELDEGICAEFRKVRR